MLAALWVELYHAGNLFFQQVNDCGTVGLVLYNLRPGFRPFARQGAHGRHALGKGHFFVYQVPNVNVCTTPAHNVARNLGAAFALCESHIPGLDKHTLVGRCFGVEEVLQPFALKDQAVRRGGGLFVLARILQGAHGLFKARQGFFVETLRVQDVAFLADHLAAAHREGDYCALRRLRREAKVCIAQVLGQNMAGQVLFVKALHHNNKNARLRVVQTGLQGVLEEGYGCFSLGFAVGL